MITSVYSENRRDRHRVLYFQENAAWGACEEYLALLIEGANKERYDPVLLCPPGEEIAPLVNAVERQARVWHLGNGGRSAIPHLVRKFRELRPDLIHFNDPCLKGIVAARLAGIQNLVLTFHTPELRVKYNWKGRLVWKAAFCSPPHLIALSERNRELLVRDYGFQPARITVIQHGLKSEKFKGTFDRESTRRELGIPLGNVVLVNVARLATQKGHEVLINAVGQLPASVLSRLSVLLVGDGENRSLIEAMIAQKRLQDVFVFAGYRTDVPRLLSASDIFVLSSHFEGMPFAIIEAMATSKPVVATDVGGVAEVVSNGQTGLVVPPRNPGALAEAITYLLLNPDIACQMGVAGRKRFEQFFTQDRMVAKTQQLYERLLGQKG